MARPSLEKKPARILYVGDSGSGKTGSLISLLEAGYKIRMLDMDNNVDSLLHLCRQHKEKTGVDLVDNLDVVSLRDKFRASPTAGVEVDGAPKAYVGAVKMLSTWDDGSKLKEWGPDTVFVMDTLTSMSRSAWYWAKGMNATAKDPRQWFAAAQDSLNTMIELITSEDVKCHVIILSHIDLQELPDGTMKGYASSLGKAMGPKIAKSFANFIAAESVVSGKAVKRTIRVAPTSLMDLKSPISFELEATYPLETGLATLFEKLTAA